MGLVSRKDRRWCRKAVGNPAHRCPHLTSSGLPPPSERSATRTVRSPGFPCLNGFKHRFRKSCWNCEALTSKGRRFCSPGGGDGSAVSELGRGVFVVPACRAEGPRDPPISMRCCCEAANIVRNADQKIAIRPDSRGRRRDEHLTETRLRRRRGGRVRVGLIDEGVPISCEAPTRCLRSRTGAPTRISRYSA